MRHDRVLSAVPIDCSHTGDEIADIVETELYKNSLNIDKLICVVRDDGANFVKACKIMTIDRLFFKFIILVLNSKLFFSFQCGAHFLHLIVSDALNLMKEEINKFESWATFFRTRTGAEVLKRHQKALNLPFKKIPKVKILNPVFKILRLFQQDGIRLFTC